MGDVGNGEAVHQKLLWKIIVYFLLIKGEVGNWKQCPAPNNQSLATTVLLPLLLLLSCHYYGPLGGHIPGEMLPWVALGTYKMASASAGCLQDEPTLGQSSTTMGRAPLWLSRLLVRQSTMLISLHFSLHASLLGLLSFTQHTSIWLENLNQGPLSCIRGILFGQQKFFKNSNWVPLDWACQLYLATGPTILHSFPPGHLSHLCGTLGSCRHLTFLPLT